MATAESTGGPSPESQAMAAIVAVCAPLLKSHGYRKRRHSFNRATPQGIVHVVNFWMAPFEPPAWTEVPGLRERRYGSFRLDFGVWVPQMDRTGQPKSAWVNEYNCNLRATMGKLIHPETQGDLWWDLQRDEAATLAFDTLEQYGLPWLERFSTHQAIFTEFEAHGPLAIGMSPAGALDVADLYAALAMAADARRTLEAYVASPVHINHASYLAEYLAARGYDDLIPRIVTR